MNEINIQPIDFVSDRTLSKELVIILCMLYMVKCNNSDTVNNWYYESIIIIIRDSLWESNQ